MVENQQGSKRLMWIVNHKTLLPAEVPIFYDLGFEVFIPKIIPDDPSYRSGVVTFDYDSTLSIPKTELEILNAHNFYGELNYYRAWSPTLRKIINKNFDVVVSSLSAYISPLREAIRHFDGLVLARVFGLTHPNRYIDLLEWLNMGGLVDEMEARGPSYAFVQGYSNLAQIEPSGLAANAHTVTVPLPDEFFQHENTWNGQGSKVVFVCPGIQKDGYYRDVYESIKRDFGDLPHCIFGRQVEAIDDPALLPYLTDSELVKLYSNAPVFVYPSTEARHIHYSPIEAMVIGTPVLYRKGSLSDVLSDGGNLAGACSNTQEMHDKANRILLGDRELAESIRQDQGKIVDAFRVDLARRQWAEILSKLPKKI